jgi:hypothetical protein
MKVLFILSLFALLVSIYAETKVNLSAKLEAEPRPGSSLRVTPQAGLNVRASPCDGSTLNFSSNLFLRNC